MQDSSGGGKESILKSSSYDSRAFISSTVLPLAFAGIFGLGFVGNAMIVFVIGKSKALKQTASNIYILNMAITDLLFVSTLPLWALQYAMNMQWPFGIFLCKLNRMATRLNQFGSIFFISALALHRWLMITPKLAKRQNYLRDPTRRQSFAVRLATNISIAIWLAALAYSGVAFYYATVRYTHTTNTTVCVGWIPSGDNGRANITRMAWWELTQVAIVYIVPSLTILLCYWRLIKIIGAKLAKSERTERASSLVVWVMVAFYACWTPINMVKLLRIFCGYFGYCSERQVYTLRSFVAPIEPLLLILAFANSCFNPIIYAFTLDKFNDNLIRIFCGKSAQEQFRQNVANKREEQLHIKRAAPNEHYRLRPAGLTPEQSTTFTPLGSHAEPEVTLTTSLPPTQSHLLGDRPLH